MTWWFGASAHSAEQQLREARSFEKEQERRLIEAYTRRYKKRSETKRRAPERERGLLGTHSDIIITARGRSAEA